MRPRHLAFLAAAALLLSGPAAATSFVMVPDEALVEQAPLVVEARVVARENAPTERPSTDYQLQVDRFLKGQAAGTTLILRVPGGERSDGMLLKIWGAPELGPGQRGIFFLSPHDDGTFRSLHLMLGTFPRLLAGDRAVAMRDLGETVEMTPSGEPIEGPEDLVRDYDAFATWIGDRAAGSARPADYLVPRGEVPASLTAKFTHLDFSGIPTRWFDFDSGGAVSWRADASGFAELPSGGINEIRAALDLWTDEQRTPIRYQFGGQAPTGTAFSRPDGMNMVHWNDPRDDIEEGFFCNEGGVLAIGGPWGIRSQTGVSNGTTYVEILEADVVMNFGIGCYFNRAPDAGDASNSGAEEVLAHEFGHTLGLGHSCGDGEAGTCNTSTKREALMRATAHNDGRGALLGGDDLNGIRFIYETGGGAVVGPVPPGRLEAVVQPGSVLLTWNDNSNDELGFRVYRAVGGEPLLPVADLPAGSSSWLDVAPPVAPAVSYQVGAYNDEGENRVRKITVETVAPEPVTVALPPLVSQFIGQLATFQALVTGPVERVEWSFGPIDRGVSATSCGDGAFCVSHLFTAPGGILVTARAIGTSGQTAEASRPVAINGNAVDVSGSRTFLQSVLFAPRGTTGTFRSDVWAHNLGTEAAVVEVTYLPRGITDPDPQQRRLTVLPGDTVRLPNVLDSLFGLPSGSQGSLVLEGMEAGGEPAALRVVSRSFVDLADPTAGSFGQLVSEDPEDLWTASAKVVTGVLEGDGFVATLLAANLESTPTTVTLQLTDATGAAAGTAPLGLGAHTMRFQRLANLFPAAAGRPQPFTVRFTSDGGRFLASATLLETGSEDQIYIPAREPATATSFLVPRVVRSRGLFDTFLVSRLVAYNPATVPTTLTIELWDRGVANIDPVTVTRVVPAGSLLTSDDVLLDLFGVTDDNRAGALRILWSNAQGIAPRVLSYAFAQRGGDRFGMLVDSIPITGAAQATVDLPASQNDLFKSSYGVVNLSGGNTQVRVVLRRGDGSQVASADLGLQPRQHLERNLLGVFPGLGEGSDWSLETTVLSGGPVITYVANINASGDVFFVPGQPR